MEIALLLSLGALGVALGTSLRDRRPRPNARVVAQLQARCAALRRELVNERMKVAACGAAACGVRLQGMDELSEYWSPSYEDVCRLADREAGQREVLAAIAEGSYTHRERAAAMAALRRVK